MTKECLLEELTYKMEALLDDVDGCEEAVELGIADGIKDCFDLLQLINLAVDLDERE